MPMKADIFPPAPAAGSSPESGSAFFTYPVRLVGEAALRSLEGAGEGKVLAAFRRSFYLQMEEGLFCIGPPSIGAGPLNAVCELPENTGWGASGLRQGSRVRKTGDWILVDGRFGFSFADAEAWRPVFSPIEWNGEEMAAGLSRLADEAERRAPREGLGRFIPGIVRDGPEWRRHGDADDAFLRAARSGAAALTGWLRMALAEEGASLSAPPGGAEALVGLGPGLTPSGDDFIGGALITLRALGRGSVAGRLAGWAAPLARDRTSLISRAHLACAADGKGAGALHETLAAVCRPAGADFSACVDAIDAVGHTSGWDALAGAAAVCSFLR
ncbi:MAG: DUF2877 domain-containing protein [bacterium]